MSRNGEEKVYESNEILSIYCNLFVNKKKKQKGTKRLVWKEQCGRWEEWRVSGLRFGWRGVKELEKQGEDGGGGGIKREWWRGWCKLKRGLETAVHFTAQTPNPVPRERGDEKRGEKVYRESTRGCRVDKCNTRHQRSVKAAELHPL